MAPTDNIIFLASASQVRARLLHAAGLDITVEIAAIDEAAVRQSFMSSRRSAVECALALAGLKAQAVSRRHGQAIVIGADQILVCGGNWFDKPQDLAAARVQLQLLHGKWHELVTAVCVVEAGECVWRFVSVPRLLMRPLSETFLDSYLAAEGERALSAVGAYRLEGRGIQLFTEIDGDYFAILGLPVVELFGYLRTRRKLL